MCRILSYLILIKNVLLPNNPQNERTNDIAKDIVKNTHSNQLDCITYLEFAAH